MGSAPTDLLVIGASGQDGTWLGRIAERRGIAWTGTSRQGNGEFEQLDPCDAAEVARVCDRLAPKRIVLLAAQSSAGRSFQEPAETWRANTVPVLNVCDWVRTRAPSVPLVFAASGDCFGPRNKSQPANEETPFAPVTPYGASKAAAALLVRTWREVFGLKLSVAYLFNHESDLRSDAFVFGKVVKGLHRIRQGGRDPIVLGDLSVVRDWGWAPDYAEAMLRMTELPEPADLVLATGHSVSLKQAVAALVAAAGLGWDEAIAAPDPQLSHHRAHDAQYADCTRAREVVGWTGSTAFPELACKLMGMAG